MSMLSRQWLSSLLVFAGVCLLTLAVRSYFAPPLGPSLEVPQTEFEILDGFVNQKRDVVVVLINTSERPLRILGHGLC